MQAMAAAVGYIKASNTDEGDEFGVSLALSTDGSTLAVGAHLEDGAGTGVNAGDNDDAMDDSGAVYVFVRDGSGNWLQQAYIKSSTTTLHDMFGVSISLSGNGDTLAVGNFNNNSAGAVHVFTRQDNIWSEQKYIDGSFYGYIGEQFGIRVALSRDGNTLAVSASNDSSGATGIDGDPHDGSAPNSGAVYIFVRDDNGDWLKQAFIKASNTDKWDLFGDSLSLSSDGNILAVGARYESSDATGVNGNQGSNAASLSGAVYVFVRLNDAWSQQAYIKASNTGSDDWFGFSVALSADGDTLAVGAPWESSNATGINGDEADNSANGSGAVYLFEFSGGVWAQQAYVKSDSTSAGDEFGSAVALSDDGNRLAVGSPGQDSRIGAVHLFARDNGIWNQQTCLIAPNPDKGDDFGVSLSFSGDGGTLAVGAFREDSAATGTGGGESEQGDDTAVNSGAVYLY